MAHDHITTKLTGGAMIDRVGLTTGTNSGCQLDGVVVAEADCIVELLFVKEETPLL